MLWYVSAFFIYILNRYNNYAEYKNCDSTFSHHSIKKCVIQEA